MMERFNKDIELAKMNKTKKSFNSSHLSNLFVPILVVACSCMAMSAVAFSAYLEEDEKEIYKVHVDIINGNEEVYEREVHEGSFMDIISSNNSFGNIECTSGSLNYDPLTGSISTPYLNRNTSCVLVFLEDGHKNIDVLDLDRVNDNTGVSYYYKGDATNNYVLLKNMMFRIVRINGDGSLRLVLNDSVIGSNYGERNDYMNSNLKKTIENWFNTNFNNESYLVESDFDTTIYDDIDDNDLVNLEGYYYGYVGTLSTREVSLITKDTVTDYLNSVNGLLLMNGNGPYNVFVYRNGKIDSVSSSTSLSVRPVINIDAKLVGTGTKNNPYVISE